MSLANLVEALQAGDEPASEDGFAGVWPVNVAIVQAFLTVSTQWRATSRGGAGFASAFGGATAPLMPFWIGLDYTAAKVALDFEGIEVTREIWRGLRVMEDEATGTLNKAE